MSGVEIKAVYGIEETSEDVSDILRTSYEKDGRIRVRVNNDLAGDVAPGHIKSLYASITEDGVTKEFKVDEGGLFIWPKEVGKNHLAVFYSHVNPDEDPRQGHMVSYCLNRLLEDVPDNVMVRGGLIHNYPINHENFHNYEPIYREGNGHAMILQQVYRTILATLGEGQPIEYVSFIEHDNLYPKEHFEFEDFEEDIMVNINHIGFTQDGFQKRQTNETWPTFSMTMKVDYAIDYLQNRIKYFFMDPHQFGLIEPMTEQHFNKLDTWTVNTKRGLTCTTKKRETKASVLHLWNGKHNTSHYQTYPKDEYFSEDPYWGRSSDLAAAYYGKWINEIEKIPD